MVYHHLAKFGGHNYASSKDMFLVCHVKTRPQDKTTQLKGQVTITIAVPQGNSPSYKVWWP